MARFHLRGVYFFLIESRARYLILNILTVTKNCYLLWQIGLSASSDGGPAVALSSSELLEQRLGTSGLGGESVVHGEVVVDDVALVAETQHALTALVLNDAVLDVDAAAVLLTHRDGGVLAVRHALLHHHVAARDVARVDAGEVRRLQPTLAHVAAREDAVAVGARHQHAALHVVFRAETQRRFGATQEPVVQLEVERVADALEQKTKGFIRHVLLGSDFLLIKLRPQAYYGF